MKPERPNSLPLGRKLFNKSRPVVSDAIVKKVMQFLEEKIPAPHKLGVDVGCGTGFSTSQFAPHFESITGIDTSSSQIEEANNSCFNDNITFQVGSADALPCTSNTVDAVLCMQTMHWLDEAKFFAECARVLRPGGIIAIMGYGLVKLKSAEKPDTSQKLNEIIEELHWDTLTKGGYWDDERGKVDRQYADLQLPYPEQEIIRDDSSLYLEKPMTIDLLIDLIGSWSGLRNYTDKNPDHPILDEVKSKFLAALDESCSSAVVVTAIFPWFLMMSRKPTE